VKLPQDQSAACIRSKDGSGDDDLMYVAFWTGVGFFWYGGISELLPMLVGQLWPLRGGRPKGILDRFFQGTRSQNSR
jgi:hypothetical protein